MADEQARVLARDGNVAVSQLDGRAFPGIHVQGDTFAELRRRLAGAAARLRRAGGANPDVDDLEDLVEEMTQILSFYEAILAERGIERPYFRNTAE